MKRGLLAICVLAGALVTSNVNAQICESIADVCKTHLGADFISDGQVYRALLSDEDIAEFQTTLFSGSTYRISACSGQEDGNLIFTMYDNENNELFSSDSYGNAPYWDFTVESTIDVRIEARLDVNRVSSGCAVLLIGFQQQ